MGHVRSTSWDRKRGNEGGRKWKKERSSCVEPCVFSPTVDLWSSLENTFSARLLTCTLQNCRIVPHRQATASYFPLDLLPLLCMTALATLNSKTSGTVPF